MVLNQSPVLYKISSGMTPNKPPILLFLWGCVLHALENPHQENVGGQLLDFALHEHTAFRTSQLFVRLHDILQAFPTKSVLTGEDFAGGV